MKPLLAILVAAILLNVIVRFNFRPKAYANEIKREVRELTSLAQKKVYDPYDDAAKIIIDVLYPAINRYNPSLHSELIPLSLIEEVHLDFVDSAKKDDERKKKGFYEIGGYCEMKVPRRVVLFANKFEQLSQSSKEIAILHEYGHCLLNRGHTNEMTTFNGVEAPASLMNRLHEPSPQIYEENKEYYFKELFQRLYTRPNLSVEGWHDPNYSPEMSDETLVHLYGDQSKN